MFISIPHFLVNVITTPEVAEHLVPNVRSFKFVSCVVQELKGSKPDSEEKYGQDSNVVPAFGIFGRPIIS